MSFSDLSLECGINKNRKWINNFKIMQPQRGGGGIMLPYTGTKRLANSVLNIKQLLLHIIKFLNVKYIVSMRGINNPSSTNKAFF